MTKTRQIKRAAFKSSQAAMVRSIVQSRIERKLFNSYYSSTGNLASGTVQYVSAVAQGDAVTNRNGNVIRPYRLDMWATLNSTAAAESMRLIVFQDRFNTGTAPTTDVILQDTIWNSPHDSVAISSGRFKILHDMVLNTGPAWEKTQQITLPLKGEIKYLAGTGASTDASAGAVFFCLVTSTVGTVNLKAVKWTLHYHDG